MVSWKVLLRPCYYAATLPQRRRLRRIAEAEHRAALVVLVYHRIADDRASPWSMSNRMFARQIDWLAERFELISLEEVHRRLSSGQNSRTAVSITFDDGYAENCQEAIPLLVRRRIPCTYFVTLENMLTGAPFTHDVCLGRRFPPNNGEQLRAMAAAGIEIGAHGYRHLDVARISDPRELQREIVDGGRQLADFLGRPVRYYAFPFGHIHNISAEALEAAHSAGYEAVCSSFGGYNLPGDSPFFIQRIPVDDSHWQLANAATLDPRKFRAPRLIWKPPAAEKLRQPSPKTPEVAVIS